MDTDNMTADQLNEVWESVNSFHWNDIQIVREIEDFEGRYQLKVRRGKNWITIAISKSGSSIRVFNKAGKEMK
jgi:hypothetical protein